MPRITTGAAATAAPAGLIVLETADEAAATAAAVVPGAADGATAAVAESIIDTGSR